MYHKYTGIILKKHPLNEADELLTIYTRETGKLRCKAVAVRKISSRLAGHLQSLNEIEFETAGNHLPVLISVRALTINNYLRENLKKFAYALVGIETLYRLSPDRQENFGAYEELRKFLKAMGEVTHENCEVRRFQLNLLALWGYALPSSEYALVNAHRQQLEDLIAGRHSGKVRPEVEGVIDQFLDYVLEREIKSTKFLNTI